MKTKVVLSMMLIFAVFRGFSTQHFVSNSGFTFDPASITINFGDTVNFTLESMHNVVEVSQATWNVDGNTPLPGGFSLGLGGGMLLPAKLTVGTHYYVCSPHASSGMKGTIVVTPSTGINKILTQVNTSLYPNPAIAEVKIITSGESLGRPYYISDIYGRQMIEGIITEETTTIDISRFTKGIYIFQFKDIRQNGIKLIKN